MPRALSLGQFSKPSETKSPSSLFSLVYISLAMGLLFFLSGCESIRYYSQATKGHLEIMSKREPLNKAMQNPKLTEDDRLQLHTVHSILDFSHRVLFLKTNRNYTTFADIGRDYVTWNVVAAHELSLDSYQWCYLFIGCQTYRGYFSPYDAAKKAWELRQLGYDVYIAPTEAYSTLGYFEDPILNTFLDRPTPWLAELIFHELMHTHLYVKNDTAFNESFASASSTLATLQWLKEKGLEQDIKSYLKYLKEADEKDMLYENLKKILGSTYNSTATKTIMLSEKETLLTAFQQEHGFLYAQPNAPEIIKPYQILNNAFLALKNTYSSANRAFYNLFATHHCDWKSYFTTASHWSRLETIQRNDTLSRYKSLTIDIEEKCHIFRSVLE